MCSSCCGLQFAARAGAGREPCFEEAEALDDGCSCCFEAPAPPRYYLTPIPVPIPHPSVNRRRGHAGAGMHPPQSTGKRTRACGVGKHVEQGGRGTGGFRGGGP
jgi:hypothetical protein